MQRIAILASGSGSNAEEIIKYFKLSEAIEVALVISNNKNAGVLEKAKANGVPVEVINTTAANDGRISKSLDTFNINFVVLAGYMKLIPQKVIDKYRRKILNIHPALLPKFGGKGMFGMNVHNAVVSANEKESGMTIHYVDENYDEGAIIFQEAVKLDSTDNALMVSNKVLKLEHKNYARIIERVITKNS